MLIYETQKFQSGAIGLLVKFAVRNIPSNLQCEEVNIKT